MSLSRRSVEHIKLTQLSFRIKVWITNLVFTQISLWPFSDLHIFVCVSIAAYICEAVHRLCSKSATKDECKRDNSSQLCLNCGLRVFEKSRPSTPSSAVVLLYNTIPSEMEVYHRNTRNIIVHKWPHEMIWTKRMKRTIKHIWLDQFYREDRQANASCDVKGAKAMCM